mmetsp:Transcript_23600/g.40100  ORF Transcript_23600/g.40100 Transcript_23600/m.40100 type:complete len:221 (-) Transcript_23600:843-1505(-)
MQVSVFLSTFIGQAGVEKREFLGAMQHIIGSLHTEHAGVILVADFVLVASKAPSRPNVVVFLQHRKRFSQNGISLQAGSWVSMLQAAVVSGHNLVTRLDQLSVDGTSNCVANHVLQINRLVLGRLGHLKHQRPVRTRLSRTVSRGVSITHLQSRHRLIRSRHIANSVVGEHSASVERTVVLGVVQPALSVVGVNTTDSNSNNVAGRVGQSFSQVLSLQPG